MIIKLGGTNGSGKTSVARALLDAGTGRRVLEHKGKKPLAYATTLGGRQWAILGSYENVCGGMDTISDKELRLDLVRRYMEESAIDVVFFEGLITGKTYGAFGAMSEEKPHSHRWHYTFMDTPFDVCVERVAARRKAAGNEAPFDPERTMRPTYRSVESVAKRAAELGHKVLWLDHTQPPAVLAKRLVKLGKEW